MFDMIRCGDVCAPSGVLCDDQVDDECVSLDLPEGAACHSHEMFLPGVCTEERECDTSVCTDPTRDQYHSCEICYRCNVDVKGVQVVDGQRDCNDLPLLGIGDVVEINVHAGEGVKINTTSPYSVRLSTIASNDSQAVSFPMTVEFTDNLDGFTARYKVPNPNASVAKFLAGAVMINVSSMTTTSGTSISLDSASDELHQRDLFPLSLGVQDCPPKQQNQLATIDVVRPEITTVLILEKLVDEQYTPKFVLPEQRCADIAKEDI
jgi:hypothetical protein